MSEDATTNTPAIVEVGVPLGQFNKLNELATAQESQIAQLIEKVRVAQIAAQQYKSDWNTLGKLLMEEAERQNWCDTYDALVDEWNEKFVLLKLPTRKKTYRVTARVTVTYDVEIEAEDMPTELAAREYVEEMGWDALRADIDLSYYDDLDVLDVQVKNVEVAS